MKIQPVYTYYNKVRLIKSNKDNNVKNKFTEVIDNRNNIYPYNYDSYYFSCNFAFTGKRICSSFKTELMEKSGDFKITQYNDITCPACGKKMMNTEKYMQITKELEGAKEDEYLDILNKYTEYMRPVEKSVFDEIQALSKKEGASKDIRTLLVGLREKKLPVLQRVQMNQVNKMTALAKTLPADERSVLEQKIKKLKYHIRKTNPEAPFRRKILIDGISKIKIRNKNQYEKLQIIAKNFPTSYDMNSAWIVKYSGKNKMNQDWSSFEIAQRFLCFSISNTDHILAYDIENNHDDISNYISMHCACNSQKSNKSFIDWISEDEARIRYLHKYFDDAQNIVDNEIKTKKYKDYVKLAKNTIYETTNGQIDLRE